MKLAFSKPTHGAAEQRQLFAEYRDHGYTGLQLKGNQYSSYVDNPDGFRRDWGDDPGSVSALITGGGLDPSGVQQLTTIVDFAAAVGSERIVFCHGLARAGLTDADIARFARIMSSVGKESADRGVALSLHHHYDNPVMHRPDFDVFFDAAHSVGLTVDTGHLAKSGIDDIAGLITDFADVIDNVHAKDYAAGEFRLLGDGDLDVPAVFAALRKTGYDGWLCVDEESGAGIRDGMRASIATVRSLVPN